MAITRAADNLISVDLKLSFNLVGERARFTIEKITNFIQKISGLVRSLLQSLGFHVKESYAAISINGGGFAGVRVIIHDAAPQELQREMCVDSSPTIIANPLRESLYTIPFRCISADGIERRGTYGINLKSHSTPLEVVADIAKYFAVTPCQINIPVYVVEGGSNGFISLNTETAEHFQRDLTARGGELLRDNFCNESVVTVFIKSLK